MGLRIVFKDCTVRLEARMAAGLLGSVIVNDPVVDVQLEHLGRKTETYSMPFKDFMNDMGVKIEGGTIK